MTCYMNRVVATILIKPMGSNPFPFSYNLAFNPTTRLKHSRLINNHNNSSHHNNNHPQQLVLLLL